ncbi:hypothetical protein BBJ28_00026588 [Nothophytophthora sp. Chile5]|nr:hypothetical protein BBJ28_00026588 [Nothophytophthora sp. Chile5]
MVFRFTTDQDKELMRELIRLKPFASPRGSTLKVWGDVAESLSRALGVSLNVKQVRDRLSILKATFKEEEAASAIGSGIEESLDAVNVQSHYDDRAGLVREYVALECLHNSGKQTKQQKKKQKDEDLARCAEEIVNESTRRRSQRATLGSVEVRSDESDTESMASAESSRSSRSSRTPSKTPKRPNAFLLEVQRQEKRQKEQFNLLERELVQSQRQFDRRLEFDQKQADDRLQFEERVQSSNRELLLECAKLFSAAIAAKKD